MPYRDVSGRWEGFFLQHGLKRPISADIHQEGDHLSGTMSDAETAFESSVSELAMEEGLPPGADEQIVEQVRSLVPGGYRLPVRAETLVPSDSVLDGEVAGDAVRFLKRYQGMSFTGYRIGDTRVGVSGEDQEVQYRGRISPDGNEIEGRWLLANSPAKGLVRTEGGFVLRKVGEPLEN
jgi:hypothetical protein